MKLNGKVVVITGAARGTGRAIAERYVKEGARVVTADLNEEGAKAVASGLGPNAIGLKLDVTDQASIDAMVPAAVPRFGGVDILVNNAGIFDLAPIVEITRESCRRVYGVNVEGLLFTLQNVNGIAPGVVDNEHWDHVDAMFAKYENLKPGEKKRIVGASVPFGRMARPDEIGGLATFLASEDADYIVAQTYNIDGGNWMS